AAIFPNPPSPPTSPSCSAPVSSPRARSASGCSTSATRRRSPPFSTIFPVHSERISSHPAEGPPMTSLFDPITVGDIALSNRIVMAPLTRNRSPGAVPNTLNAAYYEQRATAGLLITEATAITQQGQGYADVPGLYTPEALAGRKEVTDGALTAGCTIDDQM